MLQFTLAVLTCACMASAAVYRIDSLRSIRNGKDLNPSEIRNLDDQLSTSIPPLRVWTNYTIELEGGNARASFRPILDPYDFRDDNVQTLPSQYPINYPDWSTHPIKRPRYMNYQSQTNIQQNPLDLMSQQYRNLQYPRIDDTQIEEMATNIYTDPLLPLYRNNPSPLPVNVLNNNIGIPPNYSQSLHDYDQVADETRAYLDVTNELIQANFLPIVSVIDGMINAMVQGSWQFYEQEYHSRVGALINYAKVNASKVKDQINCIYNEANTGISKIRALITDVCTVSSVQCDFVIDTYVKAGDYDMNKSAQLLIALGKAARVYRENYAQELNPTHIMDKHPVQIYMLLATGVRYLEPLIEAGTEARRLFPPTYHCYV